MSYLQDIKDTKIIYGDSNIDYNKKWKNRNLINRYYRSIFSNLNHYYNPNDIYDFFSIDIDIIEGFYSFQKNEHYLIPRKNKYFLNPIKFTCSCPYFKFKKTCKHLNKYKETYNLSLVLNDKIGYSESRDIILMIYKSIY